MTLVYLDYVNILYIRRLFDVVMEVKIFLFIVNMQM